MCGIAGMLDLSGRLVDDALLRSMTTVIAHRGPDGDDIVCRGSAGLGHRRLAIIDLVTGDQPMVSDDGLIRITFNGEIYNFRELRRDLEARGAKFRTESDTEVILRAYERSEEHTSELQSQFHLVCRLLLEKKKLSTAWRLV